MVKEYTSLSEWLQNKYMEVYLKNLKKEIEGIFEYESEEDIVLMAYHLKFKYPMLATLSEKVDMFLKDNLKDKKVSFSVDFLGETKGVTMKVRV